MKVIFIYGPPAVGKYTVAKDLVTLTGYRFFHNHLTVDVAMSIFAHGSEAYYNLLRKMRFMVIEEAAKASVPGLVMTFVYGQHRRHVVKEYASVIEQNGAEILFVRLFCDRNTLFERVVQTDRQAYGKISTPEKLDEKLLQLQEPFAQISDYDSFGVDVGTTSSLQATQLIQAHYRLPIQQA